MGKLWCVITGGPSSGKSTILSRLSEMGFFTVPEAARVLIDREMAKGKAIEEIRADETEFQKKVLRLKIKMEEEAPKDRIVFLERGIPDCIAYHKMCDADYQDILELCKERRYEKIFFLKQLPLEKDYARIENEESVRRLNKLLTESYQDLGYEMITVPVMQVEERVNFILSNCKRN